MTEATLFQFAVWGEIALGVFTFVSLFFIVAPYGRHARKGWGPQIPSKLGWMIMEAPAVFLVLGIYLLGEQRGQLVPLVLLGLWQWHYVNRTFVFPLMLANKGQRMPISIMGMAITFNTLNAYVNARWLSHFSSYAATWLSDPRFIIGALVFFAGWSINTWSDRRLIALRKQNEGYVIPHGGLYEHISCPNYFGEIIEWTGYAIATWSWAGAAFAIYTFANLAPRALSNHKWYREKFPDYPAARKALIPFLV
jgi:3-oxo-5-alpha-steroid 4-dehydrogenase 1